MKKGSTLFLKTIVLLIGMAVLALCIFVLPRGISTTDWGGYRPILLGMYLPAIPFFIAVYQILKLLNLIDNNKVFTNLSVKALKYIKYCAISIGSLYAVGLPYIFMLAEQDDAPGVALIGLIFTFVPLIIASFTSVLEKMLHNAITIKSENDLTV